MYLQQLRLKNFRNFSELELRFEPGLSLLVGANGTGKSNLLEAVALLSQGRSLHESAELKHKIKWGEEQAEVFGAFVSATEPLEIGMRLSHKGLDRSEFNHKPIQRLSQLLGKIPLVQLLAHDIELCAGAPALRRRYLDGVLSTSDPQYFFYLLAYQKALRQRNAQLQRGSVGQDEFLPQLLDYGFELTQRRRDFVKSIQAEFQRHLENIFEVSGRPQFAYRGWGLLHAGQACDKATYAQTCVAWVRDHQTAELRMQRTMFGPHCDDLVFTMDEGRPFRGTGSKGELRAVALALKLAQLQWLESRSGAQAIVMIDEALHELDPLKQRAFLQVLCPGRQVLWADTRYPSEVLGLGSYQRFELSTQDGVRSGVACQN